MVMAHHPDIIINNNEGELKDSTRVLALVSHIADFSTVGCGPPKRRRWGDVPKVY